MCRSQISNILVYAASEHARDQWIALLSETNSTAPGKYLIQNIRPPFDVFTLFVRSLETTGHTQLGDVVEMSPLSNGVQCAGQASEYHYVFQCKQYLLNRYILILI